jgi:hypothetical protein
MPVPGIKGVLILVKLNLHCPDMLANESGEYVINDVFVAFIHYKIIPSVFIQSAL